MAAGVLIGRGAARRQRAGHRPICPNLNETAYRGATLQQVLDMTSGVLFIEDYINPYSDVGQIGCGLGLEAGSARQ